MAIKQFIGFGELEKFLANADTARPIDAQPVIEPGRSDKMGLRVDKQLILVTQFSPNGETMYCRIVTGRYQVFQGEVFGHKHDWDAISQSAWEIVREEIKSRGFTLREAVAAFPKSLGFLDGTAECLHFNKDTDRYERPAIELAEKQS